MSKISATEENILKIMSQNQENEKEYSQRFDKDEKELAVRNTH